MTRRSLLALFAVGPFARFLTGRVAAIPADIKYTPLTINVVDEQLIQQLQWTIDDVVRAFHVPADLLRTPR
jgi:predicted ATP-grasp superfamily ATP-dependent carboligase